MKRKKRYTVACLSGDGIGPELMGEASRALAEAGGCTASPSTRCTRRSRARRSPATATHSRSPPVPPAGWQTQCSLRSRASPHSRGVKVEPPHLTWRVQRVRFPSQADGDIAIVSPLVDELEPFVVRRAFDLARSRRAMVTAVGESETWETLVSWEAEQHPGVEVERLSLSQALPDLMNAPDRFCVVVTQQAHADLAELVLTAHPTEATAHARWRPTCGSPATWLPLDANLPARGAVS